jgi:hypothetical protein
MGKAKKRLGWTRALFRFTNFLIVPINFYVWLRTVRGTGFPALVPIGHTGKKPSKYNDLMLLLSHGCVTH